MYTLCMPAIFRTDSGIFGDIQASNMVVTGEIKVGETQQPINQYITQEINTTVGDGVDYSEEISSLSGQISGVSGYTTGVSGILHDATGDINSLSGVVSGILQEEKDDNTAFSGLSGYATGLSGILHDATGDINSLSGQITGVTGDVGEISGFLKDLDISAHYSDTDVETYLSGRLETHIIPSGNALYDIGEPENKIRHLYLSNNSLYMGGEGTNPGTQISSTPEGAIVFPSGVNISGAIGGVTPNEENNSIQWNTGTKQWQSSNTLHTTTGDLYGFYKKENNIISNVSGSFTTLSFGTHAIPQSGTAAGQAGQIAYDSNYIYLCVAQDTWRRLLSVDFD